MDFSSLAGEAASVLILCQFQVLFLLIFLDVSFPCILYLFTYVSWSDLYGTIKWTLQIAGFLSLCEALSCLACCTVSSHHFVTLDFSSTSLLRLAPGCTWLPLSALRPEVSLRYYAIIDLTSHVACSQGSLSFIAWWPESWRKKASCIVLFCF